MTGPSEPDFTRLGVMLQARRAQLGYGPRRRKEFAAQAGMSDRTCARVEAGKPMDRTPGAKAKIERAYEWAPGSYDAVLTGGEAVPTDGEYEEIPARALRGRGGDVIFVAGDDEFEMAIMDSDLQPEEKAEAIRMYREGGRELLARYGIGGGRTPRPLP
jgi:hypothetical protein